MDICVRATNRKYIYIIKCMISSQARLMTATAAFRLNVYICLLYLHIFLLTKCYISPVFLFDRIFNVIAY